MRALYISHVGMTEPLGQSQVLPYLRGLAAAGADIRLMSFERSSTTPEAIAAQRDLMRADGLRWHPLVRSSAHGLGVKVLESGAAVLRGLAAALIERPDIVHARSYLPAAVGDVIATLSPKSKLLFDCRGMLGDEYVANGQWTEDRVEYKLLKRFERRVLQRAEGVVVLTHALRGWLHDRQLLGPRTEVEVIPCCVDMRRFRPNESARREAREELGVGDRLALMYSGSLGSWYLEGEMARFAAHVKGAARERGRGLVVIVLSPTDPAPLREKLIAQGLASDSLVFRKVEPARMARYLTAGDIGMSFIQSCFSKKGSSPTKVAEYLASGMVVTLNGDIGDQAELAREAQACVVVDGYADDTLAAAATRAVTLADVPYAARAALTSQAARKNFDLAEIGVPRYTRLYRALAR